ncbi:hypothetical protein DDE82_007302 [Stemphylium lycopersici]|nr:hypothetical protein DDE82_007302 [Stemphylium lycopersici]
MVRSHSSYTASPTRFQSPQRSPARPPSQDGSQYEMDLDALGLNSTFESTELEHSHHPPVDRLDTSEIEGPEDFTMNMTYWMTADLPLAQIKSRKEANTKRPVMRMDAIPDGSEGRQATEVGGPVVVVEDTKQRKDDRSHTASTTRRPNGTSDERQYSTPPSERSMENDEKVRSFLSNLPDTEMDGALTGTPMHAPRHSFLQVPRSSPPKARSLQPTVEDYDTPRKPTHETVIRHTSAIIDTSEQDMARNKIAELQHQLEQQEASSRSRITELETIMSYTRSELESTRADNYRQKEKVSNLEKSMEQQSAEHEAARAAAEADLKSREDALEAKMHEFGEEMRLQNLSKLESMLEEFERQRRDLEQTNRELSEEVKAKGRSLEEIQAELSHERHAHERELQGLKETQLQKPGKTDENTEKERVLLSEQLSSVQARANALQSNLETATAEAKLAREEAQKKDDLRSAVEAKARSQTKRITELEGHLQKARFEVECAQADVAAKHQLFQTNLDLNARIRALQAEANSARKDVTNSGEDKVEVNELEARVSDLQYRLDCAHAGNAAKDQQLQSTAALETEVQSLRTRVESTNSPVNNGQSRQVSELEARIRSLQSQLQSAQSDLAAKDQEISYHIESQQQAEQRINTSQGRLQSVEASNASLRQQLAEAHRASAKARGDADQFERDLQDANDRLQEARAEADRRVSDLDKKLTKTKEAKVEAETKYKELRAQHDDMIEGHEAMMEDVRDKAEDAVRKAGVLLEQERSEKRRMMKDLKRSKEEVESLRNSAAQRLVEEDEEASDDEAPTKASQATEIASLRSVALTQQSDIKTLNATISSLRKENKALKATCPSTTPSPAHPDSQTAALEAQLSTLRTENAALNSLLATTRADHDALNAAMDEKLAVLLSKLMKEKARTVVGKRDGQWSESVKAVEGERELLGKVLMRQWGREEVGVEEQRKEGEGQKYKYKYVKR